MSNNDPYPRYCQKPTYGPAGFGSATTPAEHVWRFYGYAPHEEGGKEIWYCERCRLIDKRWRQART